MNEAQSVSSNIPDVLSPTQGHDLVYLNRLRHLRIDTRASTHNIIEQLKLSIQHRFTIEQTLAVQLSEAQLAVSSRDNKINILQTEINTLLATDKLQKRSKSNEKKIVITSKKNEKLRDAQYHLALAEASSKVKTLKEKLSKQTAVFKVRQSRSMTEITMLRARIGKLQVTVRNVNVLRATEKQRYKNSLSCVMKEISTMKKDVGKAKQSSKQADKNVKQLSTEKIQLLVQLNGKDVLLKESRNMLTQQKGLNAALQGELKMLVARQEIRVANQEQKYEQLMLHNFNDQRQTGRLLERLSLLADRKMGFIGTLADSIAETKVHGVD